MALFYSDTQRFANRAVADPIPQILKKAEATSIPSAHAAPILRLYQDDPLAYLKQARDDYDRRISDYVCDFTKQELLGGRLGKEQLAQAKFREGPFSVYMHITQNPTQARRLLYVKDRIIKKDRQQMVVQPEGPIARLLVNSVERPIDGREARRSARKTIADFGFARSLDMCIKYADIAKEKGRLDMRYVGEGEVDGRPTYVIERHLPIDDTSYPWPDARVIIHMDQEWHLPVACYSYEDLEATRLLGKYVYTNVRLNVGLQATDFDRKTYGL
jgi:hypothetical protein